MPGESPAGEFQALFLYLQHPRSKVSAGKTKRRGLTAYLGGPPKRQELSPLWQTIQGVSKCLQPKEAHVRVGSPPKKQPRRPRTLWWDGKHRICRKASSGRTPGRAPPRCGVPAPGKRRSGQGGHRKGCVAPREQDQP